MNYEPTLNFGSRVRELRRARSWTQGELAGRIKQSRQTTSNIEANKRCRKSTFLALIREFSLEGRELSEFRQLLATLPGRR